MTLKDLRAENGMSLQDVANFLASRGHQYRSGRAVVATWETRGSLPTLVVCDLADLYKVDERTILKANEASALEAKPPEDLPETVEANTT